MATRKARPKSLMPRSPPSKAGASKGPKSDRGSQAPRAPATRRPPTVSGKARIIVSKEQDRGDDPATRAKSRSEGKRASEVPTIPPPAPPAVEPVPAAREGKSGAVRKRPRGIAVDEVTANLSKDPRTEK
jgi:hypothetical protein